MISASSRIHQIDILRNFAVLSVVFYHLDVPTPFGRLISGGLLGVDVFFVISGFLMTKIIYEEIDRDKFSFLDFYNRRIRRIIPALLCAVLFVLIIGITLVPPLELKQITDQSFYVITISSNIFLWMQDPYIDLSSQLNPLLHTWSLSIEEQYYLFYPLALFLSLKFGSKRTLILTLSVIAIASLIGFLFEDPHDRFYLIQYRIWEFVIGALAYYLGSTVSWAPKWLTGLAYAALTIALLFANDSSPFLPAFALLACIATGYILATPTATSELGKTVVRYVANTSYSLYLYHWPVIVFLLNQDLFGIAGNPGTKLLALALSLGLADLSYRFIERPIRLSRAGLTYGAVASGMALIVAIFGVSSITAGFSFRYGEADLAALNEILREERIARHESSQPERCHITRNTSVSSVPELLQTCIDGEYWIVGDSHAADLYVSLRHGFTRDDFSQFTGSQCGYRNSTFCEAYWDAMFELIANNRESIRGLIYRAEPISYGGERNTALLDELRDLDMPLAIFGPGIAWNGRWWEAIMEAPEGANLNIYASETVGYGTFSGIYAAYPDYLNLPELQCPDGTCRIFDDRNSLMFVDGGHMSLAGARALGVAIRERYGDVGTLFQETRQ